MTACGLKIDDDQLPLPPGEGWGEGQSGSSVFSPVDKPA